MSLSFSKTLCAAVFLASPALSQDLIGFDLSSFGKTILSNNQTAGDDIMLEAAFGAYNNEFIATYSPKSVFAKMGRAVGRLDVATDAGVFPCTAFLVDDDLLMTNHHCVPGILDNTRARATAIVGVQFVAGYLHEGIEEGSERFLVNPNPVETSKPLDYTLLRVLGAKPGKDFGTLSLASIDPDDNAPFWIIGHPMGEAQRISREKCRANAPALTKDRVLHTCDTLPGNSGSPVIDAGTQQVIALHHAGSARNSINYAVPMTAILQNSSVLKSAVPIAATRPNLDQDTLADRALARLFGLQDESALESGLGKLIKDFPNTPAAKAARLRLEGMGRARKQASHQARLTSANEALLAALVLTDTSAQRRALDTLIRTHGDTPAAAAARATLATITKPAPSAITPTFTSSVSKAALTPKVVSAPVEPPKAPTQQMIEKTTISAKVYAPGSILTVSRHPVYGSPVPNSQIVDRALGSVVLGDHVSDNWYKVQDRPREFVQVKSGMKILVLGTSQLTTPAITKPKSMQASTSQPVRPASKTVKRKTVAGQIYPAGSVLEVPRTPIYKAPATSAKIEQRVSGTVILGDHVFGSWYTLQDHPRQFLLLRSGWTIHTAQF